MKDGLIWSTNLGEAFSIDLIAQENQLKVYAKKAKMQKCLAFLETIYYKFQNLK